MNGLVLYGIPILSAGIMFLFSDFFISRRQKYVHSPFEILKIRFGLSLGVFIIVISIISKI